jgi:cell wall-associated NlpC family hydrolase
LQTASATGIVADHLFLIDTVVPMLVRLAPLVPLTLFAFLAGCAGSISTSSESLEPYTQPAWVTQSPFESFDDEPEIRPGSEVRAASALGRQAAAQRRAAFETPVESYTMPGLADSLLERGFELVGTRYRYGGLNAETGFDCSGFVGFLFKEKAGIELPRSTREMINIKAPVVARSALKPGDVIFFNNRGRGRVTHAGIYIGDDKFIHSASRRSGGVRVDSLDDSYWKRSFMEAKRVLAMASKEDTVARY